MDYKIGDKVVYPNHGVGVIEQISYGVLEGRTETYYMLKITSSCLKVMVPRSNADGSWVAARDSNMAMPRKFSAISKKVSSLHITIGSTASRKTRNGCALDR